MKKLLETILWHLREVERLEAEAKILDEHDPKKNPLNPKNNPIRTDLSLARVSLQQAACHLRGVMDEFDKTAALAQAIAERLAS